MHPLARGLWRGQVSPGLPRLDPDDPMANAAVLGALLDEVGHPGLKGGLPCAARGRSFALIHRQRLLRVRFGGRAVCQLQLLKRTSSAQPGGMGEVAALILGRHLPGGNDVDVTRIVVPPFRFGRDTLELIPADLGPLGPGEQFIGTYHTHPDGDIEQGVLSEQDLAFMESGRADFHGRVGSLSADGPDIDWIFDIVEPQGGGWNVYAHDRQRLSALHARCRQGPTCPLDELRLAGSPYYLLVRYYEERDQDF
ncbi:MAG: hypothetical protein RMK29_14425 [Myxococcales bacterium]|nr:hypothetical protein [Myxococcota bacterium]MDW8282907.1 hypothetical protein [Myxococcales bacterium]